MNKNQLYLCIDEIKIPFRLVILVRCDANLNAGHKIATFLCF